MAQGTMTFRDRGNIITETMDAYYYYYLFDMLKAEQHCILISVFFLQVVA